jgi:hypothetical protein
MILTLPCPTATHIHSVGRDDAVPAIAHADVFISALL